MNPRDQHEQNIQWVRAVLDDMFADTPTEGYAEGSPEATRWDEGVAFVESERAAINRIDARQAERARIAELADIPTATVSGDAAIGNRTFSVNTRTNVEDAFDLTSIDRARGPEAWNAEVVGRARTAIEEGDGWLSDRHRESATHKVDQIGNSSRVAEQILLAASPLYRTAYFKYARNSERPGSADELTSDERSRMAEIDTILRQSGFFDGVNETEARALALTNVTGKLVPAQLDTTVILTNDGSFNPFRQIARVVASPTNVWTGVTSAGVTAEWTGTEGTEVADAAPSFANPAITCYMADAFVPISFQAYEDWQGAATELEGLFVDAKDRLEEAAFATGSGSSQPYGIVTALAATTNAVVSMATNSAYALADLYTLKEALGDRWKKGGNIAFLSAEEYLDRTRQFGTANNYHGFTVDLTQPDLSVVFGKPWHLSSTMTASLSGTTNNAIVFGNFQHYVIADRIGMVTEFIPQLFSTSNGRPKGQRGWLTHWRVGADAIVPTAFRLLQNPHS